jgi:hypothetical protein
MHNLQVRGESESSRTVTVVTASVKDEREANVTLPQACCMSLQRDTALWTRTVFTRVLFW